MDIHEAIYSLVYDDFVKYYVENDLDVDEARTKTNKRYNFRSQNIWKTLKVVVLGGRIERYYKIFDIIGDISSCYWIYYRFLVNYNSENNPKVSGKMQWIPGSIIAVALRHMGMLIPEDLACQLSETFDSEKDKELIEEAKGEVLIDLFIQAKASLLSDEEAKSLMFLLEHKIYAPLDVKKFRSTNSNSPPVSLVKSGEALAKFEHKRDFVHDRFKSIENKIKTFYSLISKSYYLKAVSEFISPLVKIDRKSHRFSAQLAGYLLRDEFRYNISIDELHIWGLTKTNFYEDENHFNCKVLYREKVGFGRVDLTTKSAFSNVINAYLDIPQILQTDEKAYWRYLKTKLKASQYEGDQFRLLEDLYGEERENVKLQFRNDQITDSYKIKKLEVYYSTVFDEMRITRIETMK